ncbi:MAG: EFR1 family ferrodoxin [Clostridiales Family XIII bacterium]|jgi:ferredoxin/flavodoxin|nr:EFR1 family ferrodoxin [Clostridiales Family XIII bacterium]
MVIYFSGTGNSRYVAKRVADGLGDECISMNERIKSGDLAPVESQRPLVFVAPVYAYRLPRIVEGHIRKTSFPGATEAYFILTCGDKVCAAAKYAARLCKGKGWAFRGLAPIVMPNNYVTHFAMPGKETAQKTVEAAAPAIRRAIEAIQGGRAFEEKPLSLGDILYSSIGRPLWYAVAIRAKGFRSTDACTGCGACARRCPLNNIRIEQGRPAWGARCTHCMACICGCPQEAVEYKDKSVGKPRHYLQDA